MKNQKPRVAIVGAGSWSEKHHIPSLATYSHADLIALVNRSPERVRELATRFGVPHAFTSVDDLIASGVSDCAIVATPHSTHFSMVSALLDAGMHVLVEKPITTRVNEAIHLVELASRKGLHLSVGYTYQFSPAASVVREWVRTRIGGLVQVVLEFSSRAAALYANTAPDDDSSAYSAQNGSGQGSTQLTHAIAALLWTTGQQVTEVAARTNNRGLAVDVDNSVVFTLTGGAAGVATSTGTIGNRVPMRHHIRYIGEHGVIDHDLIGATARLQLDSGEERSARAPHAEPSYPANQPARGFVDLVVGRGGNLGPAGPAAATVAFIEAMHHSAKENRFVPVPQIPASLLLPKDE